MGAIRGTDPQSTCSHRSRWRGISRESAADCAGVAWHQTTHSTADRLHELASRHGIFNSTCHHPGRTRRWALTPLLEDMVPRPAQGIDGVLRVIQGPVPVERCPVLPLPHLLGKPQLGHVVKTGDIDDAVTDVSVQPGHLILQHLSVTLHRVAHQWANSRRAMLLDQLQHANLHLLFGENRRDDVSKQAIATLGTETRRELATWLYVSEVHLVEVAERIQLFRAEAADDPAPSR
mmetsp:Transcript_41591/g.134423  ORF Transcript_41591/g.134423 Transcript_41591/m.134423 type:complete len:234 (-) Transcript_41591:3493-4194(-)